MMRTFVLLACFAWNTSAVSAQNLQSALDQVDRAGESFKSMSANISRISHTGAINEDTLDSGVMKLKKTKKDTKMLIEFTGAQAKTASLDGTTFKIFNPRANVVQYWNLGQNRSLVDRYLLLGFGASKAELESAYTITFAGQEKIADQPTTHLVLVPKSPDILKNLKRAELWIWDGKGVPLRQKFITSADGDSMQVTYSNLKINPALSDNDVQLKEPKGVKREYPQK